jgi:hypothetical protein
MCGLERPCHRSSESDWLEVIGRERHRVFPFEREVERLVADVARCACSLTLTLEGFSLGYIRTIIPVRRHALTSASSSVFHSRAPTSQRRTPCCSICTGCQSLARPSKYQMSAASSSSVICCSTYAAASSAGVVSVMVDDLSAESVVFNVTVVDAFDDAS